MIKKVSHSQMGLDMNSSKPFSTVTGFYFAIMKTLSLKDFSVVAVLQCVTVTKLESDPRMAL